MASLPSGGHGRIVAPIALAVMAVIGLGISAYLTVVHYAGIPLVCSSNSVIDCSAVTTSSYSVVPGTSIPVTIPGLLWFAVSGWLAVGALRGEWRGGGDPSLRMAAAAVLWSLAAFGPIVYFVYGEAVGLHKICEWCTATHLLVLASFWITLTRLQRLGARSGEAGDDEPAPD